MIAVSDLDEVKHIDDVAFLALFIESKFKLPDGPRVVRFQQLVLIEFLWGKRFLSMRLQVVLLL